MPDVSAEEQPTSMKRRAFSAWLKLPLIKMLRWVGGIGGILSIILGVYNLITSLLLPKYIIFGLYNIIFGLLMIVSEMRWIRLLKHFKFLTYFIGLGGFYVFVGGLALGSAWYELGLGISLIILGAVYTMLGCCGLSMNNEELPKFMQRNKDATTVDEPMINKSVQQPVKSVYVPATHAPTARAASPMSVLDPEIAPQHVVQLPTHNTNYVASSNKYAAGEDDNPFV